MDAFLVSSDDCLIVRALSSSASLREAAKQLRCDPAHLTRKIQRISAEHDLVSKRAGKWVLTDRGRALLRWTEVSIRNQQQALRSKPSIRIASAAWLGEQVLIPSLPELKAALPGLTEISMLTPVKGLEASLLDGEVDWVVACHAPLNPLIAHKKLIAEEWVTAVPARWKREWESSKKDVRSFLATKPFIRHSDLNPDTILPEMQHAAIETSLVTDRLAAVRAGIISGLGWSGVPRFLVQSAVASGQIALLDLSLPTKNEICLWRLRERKDLAKTSATIEKWVRLACQNGG